MVLESKSAQRICQTALMNQRVLMRLLSIILNLLSPKTFGVKSKNMMKLPKRIKRRLNLSQRKMIRRKRPKKKRRLQRKPKKLRPRSRRLRKKP